MAHCRANRHVRHSRVIITWLLAMLVAAAIGGYAGGALPPGPASISPVPRGSSATDAPRVLPGFPSDAALLLEPVAQGRAALQQLGTAAVDISIARLAGGRVLPARGPQNEPAIEMPSFTTAKRYPRAVIDVDNATNHDQLSPGTADITWGADFTLNARSEAATGVDNGDNLIQRGLFGEPAEYKAELDLRRPGCTVHGTEGILIVRIKQTVAAGVWYRMRCIRTANVLRVTLTRLPGKHATYSATATGSIGSMDFAPTVPLSIGGKLAPDGTIIKSATDQFNGKIANAVVEIAEESSE